jgi:hypothetical protein
MACTGPIVSTSVCSDWLVFASCRDAALSTGTLAAADIAEHGRHLNHIAAETAMLEERWLELQEQVEALQAQAQ